MPPPSKLAVATGVLRRLVKEEASYHKEIEHQAARIKKLESSTEDEDGNAEYTLRQEVILPNPTIAAATHPIISVKHSKRLDKSFLPSERRSLEL